ncbi:MAG: hypothetical protein ACD_12C00123G0001 [uncultured bacterium]|nr:MAG: hypothetical protein ACD_12C00123G0001 [uncultured bacterium]
MLWIGVAGVIYFKGIRFPSEFCSLALDISILLFGFIPSGAII